MARAEATFPDNDNTVCQVLSRLMKVGPWEEDGREPWWTEEWVAPWGWRGDLGRRPCVGWQTDALCEQWCGHNPNSVLVLRCACMQSPGEVGQTPLPCRRTPWVKWTCVEGSPERWVVWAEALIQHLFYEIILPTRTWRILAQQGFSVQFKNNALISLPIKNLYHMGQWTAY